MFDKTIIIPQSNKNLQIDIGHVCESLLFYNQVNLYLKDSNLQSLFQSISLEALVELIDFHGLNLNYTKNHLSLHQRRIGNDFQIGIGFSSNKIETEEIVELLLKNLFPNRNNLTKYIQKINDRIKTHNHHENVTNRILDSFLLKDYIDQGITESIKDKNIVSILNLNFFRDDKKRYLYNGKYLDQLEITDEGNNIVTIERVLDNFVFAEEQLILASEENCDISTSTIITKLITKRMEKIIENNFDKVNFKLFKETFIPEFNRISETINIDSNNIQQFVKILRRSKEFKSWINNAEDGENLISEFYKKTTEKSWIDKLPAKGIRFLFFTGAGILADLTTSSIGGALVGTVVGAGDTFLLDKLLNKWNPNFQIADGLNSINKFIK